QPSFLGLQLCFGLGSRLGFGFGVCARFRLDCTTMLFGLLCFFESLQPAPPLAGGQIGVMIILGDDETGFTLNRLRLTTRPEAALALDLDRNRLGAAVGELCRTCPVSTVFFNSSRPARERFSG